MTDGSTVGGGLCRFTEVADRAAARSALYEIFFESSSRTEFASAAERQSFLERWTGYYLESCPEDIWLWQDRGGAVAGYLTGCRDSVGAARLYQEIPGYQLFEDQFAKFPGHLHVNCRGDRRGAGIGAALVEAFACDCRRAGLSGVHVVTAPEARNVRFYQRVGFTEQVIRLRNGRPLLWLGRCLSGESGT